MARLRQPKPASVQAVTNLSVAAAQKLKDRGKKARRQVAVMIPLVVGVAVVNHYRNSFFGSAWDTPVRVFSAIALVALGWWVARDAVRAASPAIFKRLEPATA